MNSIIVSLSFYLLIPSVLFAQSLTKKINLEGSWELVSYKESADEWLPPKPNIIYQKHITDTHFTWIQFDRETASLIGMGGGTYMITDKGEYEENIQFFYPAGSSELGQSIPFTAVIKDGQWYHTGYAKVMEIDEHGEMVMTGRDKIEEIWKPIAAPKTANKSALKGTWILSSYRYNSDEPYQEYPKFTTYMKLVTDTHFIWIKYDNEGDQIFAAGGGPYTYTEDEYIEKIQIQFPGGSDLLGVSVTFKPEINDYKWIHFGKITSSENEYPVDEIWEPYSSNIEDETAFNN